MEPATVGAILDAVARALDGRARRRGDARGQSDQRRGGALPRLSRGRRQPRLARRAGARRRATCKALGRLHRRDEALDAVAIARAIFERYSFDLIYARPGQTPEAWAAELERAIARGRPSICRSISSPSSRTRRSPRCTRPASSSMPDDGCRARALRRDAGGLRRRRACRPTRSPTTRGRAPNAGTTSSTGATANMPASAPARMAGSTSTASAAPPRPRSGRRAWLMRVEARGHGVVADERADRASEQARRVPADGPAARRGHRSRRATRGSPAGRSIARRIARPARPRRGRDHGERPPARDARRLSRARRGGRRSGGVTLAAGSRCRPSRKSFGAGLTIVAAGRRHPQHREPALVGAVGAEAEQRRRCR